MTWGYLIDFLTKGKENIDVNNREEYCKLILNNFRKLDESVQLFIIESILDKSEEEKTQPVKGYASETILVSDDDMTEVDNREMKKWLFKTLVSFCMIAIMAYIALLKWTDYLTGEEHTAISEIAKIFKVILGI